MWPQSQLLKPLRKLNRNFGQFLKITQSCDQSQLTAFFWIFKSCDHGHNFGDFFKKFQKLWPQSQQKFDFSNFHKLWLWSQLLIFSKNEKFLAQFSSYWDPGAAYRFSAHLTLKKLPYQAKNGKFYKKNPHFLKVCFGPLKIIGFLIAAPFWKAEVISFPLVYRLLRWHKRSRHY